jgi:ankyrin repeat protein
VFWQGNTALMLAVKQGDLKAADGLLGAKANVQATNVMPNNLCTYVCFMVFTGCILTVLFTKQ